MLVVSLTKAGPLTRHHGQVRLSCMNDLCRPYYPSTSRPQIFQRCRASPAIGGCMHGSFSVCENRRRPKQGRRGAVTGDLLVADLDLSQLPAERDFSALAARAVELHPHTLRGGPPHHGSVPGSPPQRVSYSSYCTRPRHVACGQRSRHRFQRARLRPCRLRVLLRRRHATAHLFRLIKLLSSPLPTLLRSCHLGMET